MRTYEQAGTPWHRRYVALMCYPVARYHAVHVASRGGDRQGRTRIGPSSCTGNVYRPRGGRPRSDVLGSEPATVPDRPRSVPEARRRRRSWGGRCHVVALRLHGSVHNT